MRSDDAKDDEAMGASGVEVGYVVKFFNPTRMGGARDDAGRSWIRVWQHGFVGRCIGN